MGRRLCRAGRRAVASPGLGCATVGRVRAGGDQHHRAPGVRPGDGGRRLPLRPRPHGVPAAGRAAHDLGHAAPGPPRGRRRRGARLHGRGSPWSCGARSWTACRAVVVAALAGRSAAPAEVRRLSRVLGAGRPGLTRRPTSGWRSCCATTTGCCSPTWPPPSASATRRPRRSCNRARARLAGHDRPASTTAPAPIRFGRLVRGRARTSGLAGRPGVGRPSTPRSCPTTPTTGTARGPTCGRHGACPGGRRSPGLGGLRRGAGRGAPPPAGQGGAPGRHDPARRRGRARQWCWPWPRSPRPSRPGDSPAAGRPPRRPPVADHAGCRWSCVPRHQRSRTTATLDRCGPGRAGSAACGRARPASSRWWASPHTRRRGGAADRVRASPSRSPPRGRQSRCRCGPATATSRVVVRRVDEDGTDRSG